MTPDSAQAFGVALMAMWGAAGAVALGRSVAKSPAARELAAAVRKMNLAAKGMLVAGLVAVVAIGGTKPGGGNPPRNTPNTRNGSVSSVCSVVEPRFALVEVRTNGVALVSASTNAVVSESVRRHGTSEGGEWIETETPFFRWGTNPVSRVFASPAVLSFGTMRHPALGATLPDGTSAESLVALRLPLGLVPEANWGRLAAPSRFWHEATAFGRVFTWGNALLDRQADRPATIQIETRDDGDFAFRYDFSAAAPTNDFLVGAQLGPAAIEALTVRGGVTNAATVYRVNGAPVPAGVSVADLFNAASALELRWKNVADLGDLSGDTDGDGLSDGDEIYLYGTDPRCEDTDGDGLSDAAEILVGLSPTGYDADDDGLVDGIDPHPCISDGNGFGTSALWVQCSFTNAAEILSEGYAAYVSRLSGETNGVRSALRSETRSPSSLPGVPFFRLQANVSALPPNGRLLIVVGDHRIVANQAGTFDFLLEKGREYELRTDAPQSVLFTCPYPDPVIRQPSAAEPGLAVWHASGIEVVPATHHYGMQGEGFPFSASCLDCHPDHATGWTWASDCPDLLFETPRERDCVVRWTGESVSWDRTNFTVSCTSLGETLSAEVWVTFGDHETPQAGLVLSMPAAFFVNDDDDNGNGIPDFQDVLATDDDDLVPLAVSFSADAPMSGTLRIEALEGASGCRVWADPAKETELSLPILVFYDDPVQNDLRTYYVEAVGPSPSVNGTRFRATFEEDGDGAYAQTSARTTAVHLGALTLPDAPATGLAALVGSTIRFQIDASPNLGGSELGNGCTFYESRRITQTGYDPWVPMEGAFVWPYFSHVATNGGIYTAKTMLTIGNMSRESHLSPLTNHPYSSQPGDPVGHFGIASSAHQLLLREAAVSWLGDTDYSLQGLIPSQFGFSGLDPTFWKCSLFVAHTATRIGQTVPVLHHGQYWISSYPPSANDWATGTPISGWRFLGNGVRPEPGWIVGHPAGGHGHVGIVDYDGWAIAAGTSNVNRRFTLFLDGSCGYDTYEGTNP